MLKERPHPRRPYLVIEVAHSSLRYDREVKSHLHASLTIPDYWIINLLTREVEVYRQPAHDSQAPFLASYQQRSACKEQESISAQFCPDKSLVIGLLLPDPE